MRTAPPEEVQSFHIEEKQQSLDGPYNKTTILSWDLPCRSNGVLEKFRIECINLNSETEALQFEVNVGDSEEDVFHLVTEDFSPGSSYNVTITAFNELFEGKSLSRTIEIEAGSKDLKLKMVT